MDINPELHRKMELYASGQLEGRALQDFEQELERNPDLRKETLYRKAVVDAINEARREELKNHIFSKADVRLASNPWGKVWLVASSIIIIIAAAVYFLDRQQFFNNDQPAAPTATEPVAAPVIADLPDTTVAVEDTNATISEEKSATTIASSEEREPDQTHVAADTGKVLARKKDTVKTADTLTAAELNIYTGNQEEEIIVKRDELLATINLKPIYRTPARQPAPDDLSTGVLEKLNPEAKLPEQAPAKTETYRVELWKSPINFKGYRLVKNRLTLFGIEQNVILRLHRLNDDLYLEYEPGTYSKLYPGDQFNAFVKVRNPEVLNQLNQ